MLAVLCGDPMTHDGWHNEKYMSAKRLEVVNTAQMIRDGKMNVVEGSWRLAALQHDISRKDFEEDFMLFVGIASETDHLPVGEARKLYSPEALRKADAEIASVDKLYRGQVEPACEQLMARFGDTT